MKCAQHQDQDAVGACNTCSRGLCSECVSAFSPPTCPDCVLVNNRRVAGALKVQLAMMAGLFVVSLFILAGKVPLGAAILYSLMAGFFPAGWTFLGRYFSPSGGYLGPMARWMNLAVQAAVAALFGLILGPLAIYKAWKELSTVHETKELIGKD